MKSNAAFGVVMILAGGFLAYGALTGRLAAMIAAFVDPSVLENS